MTMDHDNATDPMEQADQANGSGVEQASSGERYGNLMGLHDDYSAFSEEEETDEEEDYDMYQTAFNSSTVEVNPELPNDAAFVDKFITELQEVFEAPDAPSFTAEDNPDKDLVDDGSANRALGASIGREILSRVCGVRKEDENLYKHYATQYAWTGM